MGRGEAGGIAREQPSDRDQKHARRSGPWRAQEHVALAEVVGHGSAQAAAAHSNRSQSGHAPVVRLRVSVNVRVRRRARVGAEPLLGLAMARRRTHDGLTRCRIARHRLREP